MNPTRKEVIDMQKGRGGMGSHKHGTSGVAPMSPKTKFMLGFDENKNAAAKEEIRKRQHDSQRWTEDVKQLIEGE